MRHPLRIPAVAVLVIAALAAWRLTATKPAAAPAGARSRLVARPLVERRDAAPPSSAEPQPARVDTGRETLPDLPTSLRDTEVDGELATDADGRLVITAETRRLFDYFFSASGEEAEETIIARIHSAIDERLPAVAAAEARELLARYVEYRGRARDLFVDGGEEADLALRVAQIHALRLDVFGERETAALFGDEAERERFAVEAQRQLADPALRPAQRREVLEDLEGAMPASVRAERDAALGPLRLARDEDALRQAGGSPEEIRALREMRFGKEAAERLEELDRRRVAWRQRLDAYRAERAAIDADASLTPAQRDQRVEDLRQRHFEPQDLARVRALDTMAAAPADGGGVVR